MRRGGITFKLISAILASVSLVFLAVVGVNYWHSRKTLLRNAEAHARNLTRAATYEIDAVLQPIEASVNTLANLLELHPISDEAGLEELLESLVGSNERIFGSTAAFDPFAFKPEERYFAPYLYREGGEIRLKYLGGEDYDYHYWTWYQLPKELERPVWSEPYFDEGGGKILMSTYSVPIYRREGETRRFVGILTADISLEWLQDFIASIRLYETGNAFLISRNGVFITHSVKTLIMNDSIFGVAEAREDPALREIGREMIRGGSGFVPFVCMKTEEESWMAYGPVPANGWSLGVVLPRDELMADVFSLGRWVLLVGGVGLLLLAMVIVLIARSITRPIRLLAGITREIAEGNLDGEAPPIRSRDEVGHLALSFEIMKRSLKQHIQKLTETTAAKERIESELSIAREIQMGILKRIFPPFPDRPEFELFAMIEPAREVGGDLYDFFFLDDHHLLFMIGDVSGKGVPASLFMAVTKTLLKAKAEHQTRTDEVVTKVNQDLAEENQSCMFVTLFCGILDTRTGEIHYTNAGHNPPLLVRKNAAAEYLPITGELAVGVLEDAEYSAETLRLEKGDLLFIYTDGVTEAMDTGRKLYGEERLEKIVPISNEKPVAELIGDVLEDVEKFSEGAEQADDITMLVLRYKGSGEEGGA